MTMSMLKRYEHAEKAMLMATMPKTGVVDVDDLPALPRLTLTGKTWSDGKRRES